MKYSEIKEEDIPKLTMGEAINYGMNIARESRYKMIKNICFADLLDLHEKVEIEIINRAKEIQDNINTIDNS